MKCVYLDCHENRFIFCNEEAAMKVKVPCHEKAPLCRKHGEQMVAWGMSKANRLGAVRVERVSA